MSSGARDGAPGHLAAPPLSSAAATTAATAAAATAVQGGGGRTGPPNYHRLEKLGKGSFATVYRAVHVQTNQEAAIKHISQERLTVKLQENLESEISILKNHAHRNIVRLYDIERNDRHIYIVLEYCRGGDLQKFIKTQPRGRLSEGTARHFMRHLAAGLKFLYDRNLVHRDIKPQNLLLTEPSPTAVLKIADFGFARHLEGTSMAETLCGSPLYMAPEILGQNQYNAKADLWSTGAVLFEMVAGRPPFAAQSQVELLKVIRRPLQIPSDVELSRACLALLQGLLKREPLERISFEGFFQDHFLDMKGSGFLERATAEDGVCGGEQQAAAVGKASTPREPEMPLANRRLTSIQEAPEATAAAAAVAAASPQQQQQQHLQGPRLHRADSGSRRSSSGASAAPPPPPFGLGDDDGHDSGIGGGDGGQGRHSACSSSSSSLPFHAPPPSSSSSRATATTLPSPRVNPFKHLAASPPGAVAVSAQQQQGRGSGAGQSGSGSGSSSSSSSSGSAGGRRGAAPGGMGEGSSESLESDGFVIVNAGGHSISPRNLASAAATPATPSRSASASTSMGTQTGSGPLLPTPSRSGGGSGWGGGGGGGGMGRTPTHAAGKSSSSSSCTSSSSSSSSSGGGGGGGCSARDSVDGALRALSYLEASTRRAILIASLGDAKAMAGLNHRQRVREEAAERRSQQRQQQDGEEKGEGGEGGCFGEDGAGVGGLMQGLGLGGWGLGLRKPPEWAGADRSPPARQQQQHPNPQLKALEAAEAKAAALLVEALVLYLKALSVVGTGIKALRQVADVIHMHLGGSGSGQGHWRAASSGSLEAGGAVHERIGALREWLELHLSIVLDRAQECRMQIGQGLDQPGKDSTPSSSHNMSSASALLASAGAAAGGATRSAEELLYKHALSLAREGAVKELVGHTQGALEFYAQARLTMEALLAEPLLPPADQQLLERYVEELAASCARLAGVGAASAAAATAGVTAAAVTFGAGGGALLPRGGVHR